MRNQVQDILLHHDTKLEKPWEHRLAYGALCYPAPYKRARGDARYSAHAIEEHVCHLAAAAGNKELNHIESQSMRHTSREFLRVIQGGTAALPRLQAEEA